MREKEARYDHSKHMLYSKSAKKAVLADIARRCHGNEDLIWARTREKWSSFVDDMVPMGGKKNMQSGAVYDSILLFAYYDTLPKKMTLKEFEDLCNSLFVPQWGRMKVYNFNNRVILRLVNKVFSFLGKRAEKNKADWPGNYTWDVEPYDPEIGIRYRFHTCPIADFARTHGFNHLMSAMCNGDYPMLKIAHAGLIRHNTCSNGDCCDYWIVGSDSPHLKEHPVYRDEEGYLRND